MFRKSPLWILVVVNLILTSKLLATSIDSLPVLTEQQLLEWVNENHPAMAQVRLLERNTQAYELKARGGVDPKVYADIAHKSFDGKNYYAIGQTGVKIPTWLGGDVKAGYNWANGINLNPEETLPTVGQAFLGIEWSLGRGLLMDERRADRAKADLLAEQNRALAQQLQVNIRYEAGKLYWDWVYAYNEQRIYEQGLALATTRFEAVKMGFEQGDKPAMDTLESLIRIQNLQLTLSEKQLAAKNNRRLLYNYLWENPEEVAKLNMDYRPPNYEDLQRMPPPTSLPANWQMQLDTAHPTLRLYRLKQASLAIEERLKREQLKPRLDVSYNFLASGADFFNTKKLEEGTSNVNALFTENYKLGLNFEMPIFLRKERADLALTRLKQLETQYDLVQKQQTIPTKVQNYQAAMDNTLQQITLAENMVQNYNRLLTAEYDRFKYGESSIFLINSREQKLIDAQAKYLKLLITYQKQRLGWRQAIGQ